MQISLRLRLDTKADAFVAEFEPGATVARSVALGALTAGGAKVQLNLDADGYVVSVSVPGMAEILADIAKDDAEQAKHAAAPPPKRAG